MKSYIVGEIGINHNGSVATAKKLIDVAADAGADAVKFQKRDIDSTYTQEYLDGPRESPWGNTQRDQKEGLEFGFQEYGEIDAYCRRRGIDWFASPWDLKSVEFLKKFDTPFVKIASALITNFELLELVKGQRVIISTGMSTEEEIDAAVQFIDPEYVLHCHSAYPSAEEELNLRAITTLKQKYPDRKIGYSGHERGVATSVAAAALGAEMIERHITLDRTMYGSDQSASLEPLGFDKLVKYVRSIEHSLGDGVLRVYDSEKPARDKLRSK